MCTDQERSVDQSRSDQLRLSFTEVTDEVTVYEYAVLVTSLVDEILTSRNTIVIVLIARRASMS